VIAARIGGDAIWFGGRLRLIATLHDQVVVLLHRPGHELDIVDTSKWDEEILACADRDVGWYWCGRHGPDLPAMQAQHDHLAEILRREGV
jgi:hypothetical protein